MAAAMCWNTDPPEALIDIFHGETHEAVDRLRSLMLLEVEEEVLSHLVARALEESNTPEEAAGTFYKILGDLGIFLSSTAPSADNSDDDGKPSATTLAQSASFTCPVCYYERKAEEKFVTACPNKEHSLCYDCAEKYIQAHAQSGQADIGCFEQDCDHELEPLEIALVLGQGDAENGRRHTLYEQIIGMKTISSIATHPDVYATCPKERCGWTVARSRPGETEKATCGECDFDFCTNCRHEYHYRTSCIERPSFTRNGKPGALQAGPSIGFMKMEHFKRRARPLKNVNALRR